MEETAFTVTGADSVRLTGIAFRGQTAAAASRPPAPILLLHGWPNGAAVWRAFATAVALADSARALYALNLRGYGTSGRPAQGYTLSDYAADAIAAAGALFKGEDWVLMGHSMSGKIAQVVAAEKPAGLKQLVLLSPTPLHTEPLPESAKKALSSAHGTEEGVREFASGLPARPLPDALLDELVQEGLAVSKRAWDAWVYHIRDEDRSSAAAEIGTPTLVIAGGRDPRASVATLKFEVAGKIAGARLEILPGSGHLPHLEEPNALAALVVNFLDGTLPPEVS